MSETLPELGVDDFALHRRPFGYGLLLEWWTWQFTDPLTCCPTMNLRPWLVGCESIPAPRSSRVTVDSASEMESGSAHHTPFR